MYTLYTYVTSCSIYTELRKVCKSFDPRPGGLHSFNCAVPFIMRYMPIAEGNMRFQESLKQLENASGDVQRCYIQIIVGKVPCKNLPRIILIPHSWPSSADITTPCPEKKRPRYFQLQLSHSLVDFYNFCTIGNRNKHSTITCNLFT